MGKKKDVSLKKKGKRIIMSSLEQPKCRNSPSVLNGKIIRPSEESSEFDVGVSLQLECNFNFEPKDATYSVCTDSGFGTAAWMPPTLDCVRGPCHEPTSIRNGRCVKTHKSPLEFRYECERGYRFEGNDTYACENGQWTPRFDARCVRVTCPHVEQGTFANGYVRYGMVTNVVDSLIEYVCDEGYVMAGGERSVFWTCGVGGEWEGPSPRCEKILKVPADANAGFPTEVERQSSATIGEEDEAVPPKDPVVIPTAEEGTGAETLPSTVGKSEFSTEDFDSSSNDQKTLERRTVSLFGRGVLMWTTLLFLSTLLPLLVFWMRRSMKYGGGINSKKQR